MKLAVMLLGACLFGCSLIAPRPDCAVDSEIADPGLFGACPRGEEEGS